MRVLFVVNSLKAKFPVELAQRLESTGACEIRLFTLLPDNHGIQTFLHKLGFILRLPSIIKRLKQAIAEYQPDVIHTHFWLSDVIGEYAARSTPEIRLVSTQHDEVQLTPIIAGLKQRALRRFSRVTAISKSVEQFVKNYFRVPAERVKVLYNGIDIQRFMKGVRPDSSWGPTIGLIARLETIKGGDIFIESFKRLAVREKIIQAIVIGSGSQRKKLERRCQKADLDKQIRFVGTQENLIPLLTGIDIVVVPSRSEGLSITILEALAANKLVVASDIGGIPEIIGNRHTGLLVPSENAQALAEALQWAIQHPADALAIRRRGHEWLIKNQATFDIANTIRSYANLYANL